MNELVIGPARQAGAEWAAYPLVERLRVVRILRRLLGREATALAQTLRRPVADTLVTEVLPLAEAARFLLRKAPRLLAPQRLRGGRPLWLMGVTSEIRREPCGVVLVLAPSNYPLFLPGVQALQALTAGNSVCVKPAPGCSAPMEALAGLLARAGLPDGVFTLLSERDGEAAMQAGFDRVVLTGSSTTGRAVLAAAARTLTPVTAELSGSDPVFVLPGADLDLVAACLSYGLRLNAGATCIAPRRVFVPPGLSSPLEMRLRARVEALPDAAVPPEVNDRLERLATAAVAAGARPLLPWHPGRPMLLADARPEMELLNRDVFAPWLALVPTDAPQAAAARCAYALGASVFGPPDLARAFAGRVRAGSVCINDVIVPTADPRLPFGGRGESGYGLTRGAEGLLEMTVVKTVSVRRRFRMHLQPPREDDARRYAQLIRWLHGAPWRA